MIKNLVIGVTILLIATFLIGCQMGPQLSPMQIRQLTTRTIEGSYENVFKATLTVLQDQQYIIKNTDMDSGLIVANVDRSVSAFNTFMTGDKGSSIEASCMVNKMSETSQDLRINIQETYLRQGIYGSTDKRVKPIYDQAIYQNLFNQVLTEVKRREAIQK